MLWEPILCWIIWSLLPNFHFKNLKDSNPTSFTRFQCILHDSPVVFSVFQKFFMKDPNSTSFTRFQFTGFSSSFPSFFKISSNYKGGTNILGGANSAEQLTHLLILHLFNFKHLIDPNSMLFITFQCILHDSVRFYSVFQKFLWLKRRNFKNLKNPNSTSFIRFQCIIHDSAVVFLVF